MPPAPYATERTVGPWKTAVLTPQVPRIIWQSLNMTFFCYQKEYSFTKKHPIIWHSVCMTLLSIPKGVIIRGACSSSLIYSIQLLRSKCCVTSATGRALEIQTSFKSNQGKKTTSNTVQCVRFCLFAPTAPSIFFTEVADACAKGKKVSNPDGRMGLG